MHKISCPQTRRVRQSTDGGNIRLISVRLKANQCFRPGAETGSGFNNGVSLKAFRHRHKFTHRARESGKRRQSKRPGTGQEPAVVIQRNHSRYRVSGRVDKTQPRRRGRGCRDFGKDDPVGWSGHQRGRIDKAERGILDEEDPLHLRS